MNICDEMWCMELKNVMICKITKNFGLFIVHLISKNNSFGCNRLNYTENYVWSASDSDLILIQKNYKNHSSMVLLKSVREKRIFYMSTSFSLSIIFNGDFNGGEETMWQCDNVAMWQFHNVTMW